MPSTQELLTNLIPFADQLYVDRLRIYLNDTAAQNDLELEEESTDIELWHAIEDTVEQLNYEVPPIRSTAYANIAAVPSWTVVKLGAVCQIIMSKAIHSSRNQLTWNDAGGITVRDKDRYGRYINLYNVLYPKYERMARQMKMSSNIDDCYGAGVHSEYYDIGY